MGKLTLIFNHFEKEHFGKDVFLVPYYIGKKYNYNVTIVYPITETNADFPEYYKGVKLEPLRFNRRIKILPFWRTWNFYMYIIKNAKSIDLFMRIHFSIHTKLMIVLYKYLNRKGYAYVKSDTSGLFLKEEENKKHTFSYSFFKILSTLFRNKVDKVSCETTFCYENILKTNLTHYHFGDKLVLMPNGFDEELLQSLDIKERSFAEKENLIITVGRIGTEQKNNQMLLRALSNIDLKNWKVLLIGPIEDGFKTEIEQFYMKNPSKKDSVKFIGPIYDKKELWEYYNRSKVFVLTSNHESFALVLNEAQRFRNFLVSTPVGAFEDLTKNGKFGKSVPLNNDKDLSEILSYIINGNLDINVYDDFDINSISWSNIVDLLKL